jgi:hypothetical protein
LRLRVPITSGSEESSATKQHHRGSVYAFSMELISVIRNPKSAIRNRTQPA